MNSTVKSNSLYFRSTERKNNQIIDLPVPEHERLNAHQDPPELRKIRYQERTDKIRQEFRNLGKKMTEQAKPQEPKLSLGTLSGFGEDHAWDNNLSDIPADSIPTKPEDKFSHTYEEAPDQTNETSSPILDKLKEATFNQVLIVFWNDIVICNSFEEAEEMVEFLIFKEGINIEEISIIQKKNLKLGVSIA